MSAAVLVWLLVIWKCLVGVDFVACSWLCLILFHASFGGLNWLLSVLSGLDWLPKALGCPLWLLGFLMFGTRIEFGGGYLLSCMVLDVVVWLIVVRLWLLDRFLFDYGCLVVRLIACSWFPAVVIWAWFVLCRFDWLLGCHPYLFGLLLSGARSDLGSWSGCFGLDLCFGNSSHIP